MIPANNESLNDKMDQASLKVIMPGFDKEIEWTKLSQKLHPPKSITYKKNWAYAAAIIFLLSCGGALTWLIGNKNSDSPVQATNIVATDTDAMHEWIKSVVIPQLKHDEPLVKTAEEKEAGKETQATATAKPKLPKPDKTPPSQQLVNVNATSEKRHLDKKRVDELLDYYKTKEFICNSTPCPLQICILQTVKCNNDAPAAVATCSTIEPDQARQLKYKINNTHDCNVTIDEIRITRVNTGETIVLNANSKPSTAQDLFDYITGEKEGDLLTGIFHSDCYKNKNSQNLTIDKDYGDFIIK